MSDKKMRGTSRTYFHEGRTPEALLLVSGRAYSGRILDYSPSGIGLGLSSRGEVKLAAGELVEEIFLGRTESDCSVRGLEVVYVNPEGNEVYVGLFARDEQVRERLAAVIESLFHKDGTMGTAFRSDRIPMPVGEKPHSQKSMEMRLEWAEAMAGVNLKHLRENSFHPENLSGNIENYVGAVQIPVGLAGPVLLHGTYVNGYVPVPIATTEGARVASITRGARVCALAGGIRTHVHEQVMHRAPLFLCKTLEGAVNLGRWIETHVREIATRAEAFSNVAKLMRIEPFVHGRTLHVTFSYSTGDAAGQNMTTACTWHACEWIVESLRGDTSISLEEYFIEGNHSADKKANFGTFTRGRGISVYAEVCIRNSLLKRLLRTNARTMVETWNAVEVSAMRLGMLGCNINFANVVGGVFAATGQDIASVHESSIGILKMSEDGDGIRVSAYLPSLVIGTIGGGTGLPTQKEGLQIAGCYGAGNVFRLAEIIAATCLSLDLSTGAAIASNEFVIAHERLGRNRPSRHLSRAEITPEFFTSLLEKSDTKVVTAREMPIDVNQGISTSLLSKKRSGISGVFRYDLEFTSADVASRLRSCVLKLKSSSDEMVNIGIGVAKLSGDDVIPGLFEANRQIFGFEFGDVREIEILKRCDPAFLKWSPEFLGSRVEPERALYAILMEDLAGCELLDSVNTPELWSDTHIESVLNGLAEMHAVYLGRPEEIPAAAHIRHDDCAELTDAQDFLLRLTEFNRSKEHGTPSEILAQEISHFLSNLESNVAFMAKAPSTLSHNDCNPRNLALRSAGNGKYQPVFFDWELACWQNPQRDVVEFLCFVLHEGRSESDFVRFADFYHAALRRVSKKFMASEADARKLLELNLLKFAAVRLNLYALVAPLAGFTFLPRVSASVERALKSLRN